VSRGSVRDFLARHHLLARRDLGQNFLVDESLAERLVALSGVEPGDAVVEIGTGLGVLTRALARRATRVATIEVDAGIVRALRAEGSLPANVELLHADALQVDLAGLAAELAPRVRLVANLPYAISGPLLRRLLDLRTHLLDWSVMVQREVAARLLARPGTRAYGSLSVLHGLTVVVHRELELPPGCFQPVPRVRSTFLRIEPLDAPLVGEGELREVEGVVRAAFATRRKTLANSLRGSGFAAAAVQAALLRVGLDPRARAETVPPERFAALARALRAAGASGGGDAS
jgi:16S rRNA (adenine1518-N6/adenine1519-N6)-dimethyltransferase